MSRSRPPKAKGVASSLLLGLPLAALLAGLQRPQGQAGGRQRHSLDGSAAFAAPSAAAALRGARPLGRGVRSAVRCGAGAGDSASWVLPTVDKDVEDFHKGRAGSYAWVQTSETLYVFAPMPPPDKDADEDGPPKVELSVKNEGWDISFNVEGTPVLQGRLAHAVKPGSEIWMIEEARDGRSFAVAEFDKLHTGLEWTSVLWPEVSFAEDYSKLKVEQRHVTSEEQAATVEATLGHLQRKRGYLKAAPEGHLAVNGNVLSVDIQGFELGPDGERGGPLEVGSAQGMQFELGSEEGGLLPEIHQQLLGATAGETRDVQVTLGQRGGSMGGQRIIIAVSVGEIKEQVLPDLDDEFARAVKREEQFAQAGTEQGIPEEEQHAAETFTIEQLRAEIAAEVAQHTETEARHNVQDQLIASLMSRAEVRCDWGDLSRAGRDAAKLLQEEELAAVVHSVAEREGLLSNIDSDTVDRQTWHVLGTPKDGQTIAEVGDDPAREFQEAKRKVLRRHEREQVLRWLQEHAEIAEPVA